MSEGIREQIVYFLHKILDLIDMAEKEERERKADDRRAE